MVAERNNENKLNDITLITVLLQKVIKPLIKYDFLGLEPIVGKTQKNSIFLYTLGY